MDAYQSAAIISGGASGIGLALAKKLASSHHLVLIGRSRARLEQASTLLKENFHATVTVEASDVTNRNSIEQIVRLVHDQGLRINYLIAAAGICRPHFFDQGRIDDHAATMAVNYMGTVNLIYAALPYMKVQQSGHLILFSSACVFSPLAGYSSYTPSKAAIASLGKTLSTELKSYNIRTHTVFPPDTDTEQYREEIQLRPAITQSFAQLTGLWPPDAIATYILDDIARGKDIIIPARLSKFDAYLSHFLWPYFKSRQIALLRK